MRTEPLVFLFLLIVSSFCLGQRAKAWGSLPQEPEAATHAFPPELRNQLAQLRDAALADDYAYKQLEHLADGIGPRPAGSPQADAAANYVADEMRKLGLDVRLEPVPVRRFLRGNRFRRIGGVPRSGARDEAEDCCDCPVGECADFGRGN